MRKRHDAASKLVVFYDILTPIDWGTKAERAFELILEQCGYEPIWVEAEDRMTLRFRAKDGSVAPEAFSAPIRYGPDVTRQILQRDVLGEGLQGWRALGSDQFHIEHSIAERTIYTVWNRPSYA